MKKKLFYLYTYTDPRNDNVFYVGKGTGKRLYKHLNDVKTMSHKNLAFVQKLLDIWTDQQLPIIEKVMITDDERYCLEMEERLINSYGINNLVNVSTKFKGGLSEVTRLALRLRKEKNLRCGSVKYGCKLASNNMTLIPDDYEQSVINLIVYSKDVEGLSYNKILDKLTSLNIRNRNGNIWHRSQLIKQYKLYNK